MPHTLSPASPTPSPHNASVRSPWVHGAFALWVIGMLYLAWTRPELYESLVQEDRLVEWWTVFLFLGAGVAFTSVAWRGRRLGDAGVAAFCLAAAGEEVSWGQRILGFTPSSTFLEHNAQQEANLHNLVEAFGQPKWTFIAVLVAYGIAVPALAQLPVLRRVAERSGLTIPDVRVAVWFAIAVAVLVWYPVRLTGEWVEALGGALFLAAAPIALRAFVSTAALALVAAVAAERGSALVSADPARVACARAEAAALLADVRADSLAPVLADGGRTHRRIYSLWRDGDLDSAAARRFATVSCPSVGESAARRRYAVDPWGTAYWLRASTHRDGHRLSIYSFGPNRRRDDIAGTGPSGDDIGATNEGR